MTRFIRTLIRVPPTSVPTAPADILDLSNFDLALPVSEPIAADKVGGPYAGGELKYSNASAADIAQSDCWQSIFPIGRLTNEWFKVALGPDNVWEVPCKAPVFGSVSNAFEGSDHTRTEGRSRLKGSAPASSKGEFLQVDKARLRGTCRPMRWPDNDANGRPASGASGTISHNLTVCQIHDLSLVFVIVLLRKKTNGLGRIEFTSRNVDQSARPSVVLHDDVPLESLLDYQLVWGPDANLYWRSRVSLWNGSSFGGYGAWNEQVIPCDPGWANRPQYFKAFAYHGTGPEWSTDYLRGAVVNGVLPVNQVTDYIQVNYRFIAVDRAP